MDKETIIIGAVALIILIIVIRFLTKKAFKILLVIVLLAAGGLFGYIYLTGIHTIRALEDKYCNNFENKTDSLKCVCIIQPISDDFHSRFTDEDLKNMDEVIFAKELSKSLYNKRSVINQKLKENNAMHLLKDFKNDFFKDKLKISE